MVVDGEHHVLATHLVVSATTQREAVMQVKQAALSILKDIDKAHTTIEVEYEDEDCWMREGA
jgi:cobalt-zinc-cadmium efflux system protein